LSDLARWEWWIIRSFGTFQTPANLVGLSLRVELDTGVTTVESLTDGFDLSLTAASTYPDGFRRSTIQ